jgi:HlyD family secretion protein
LSIVERGALESAKNTDIVCRVKARSQQSQNSTTIKWVIDDGSHVLSDRPKEEALSIITWDQNSACYVEKPANPNGGYRVMELKDNDRTYYADLLVDLDDSGLQENLKDQKIVLDKAEADKIAAEEAFKIQISLNESDLQNKRTVLELATIDLEKYQQGDFPQSLKDVEGRIKVSESDLEQQRDRAAWAQRMLKKGYYTVSQSDSEQSKLQSLELARAKVLEEKRVLVDPAYGLKKRTETDLRNKVALAGDDVERAEGQARAKEVQFRTDRDAKKSIWEQGLSKYQEIKDEIKKCKLYAPQEGLVVYYVPEQTRWGVGRQAVVAQSEMVAENQKLMQIPDLKHMFVNTKVHEALSTRVHRGQPATIRVDAMAAGRRNLKGHVDSVANTASQQDFFASDVKVYATKVMIDEEVENLKPGMTAEVTITVADALEDVLTVPVEAIVGSAEMGKTRRCFVMTPDGPQERDVVVGMTNDKEVEIREGLKEGEEVVLNPRTLVGEKVKIHQPGEGKNEAEPSLAGPKPGGQPGKEGTGGLGGPAGAGGPPGGAGGPPGGAGGPPGGAGGPPGGAGGRPGSGMGKDGGGKRPGGPAGAEGNRQQQPKPPTN